MGAEYWILAILAVGLALVVGFVGGRMSSANQRQVEAMQKERDTAREEAEAVRAEVSRHFEESARMFGKLAGDYRAFFQQFAQTAQNLGLSEGRARQLLQQADPSLVEEAPVNAADERGAAPGGAEAQQHPPEAQTAEARTSEADTSEAQTSGGQTQDEVTASPEVGQSSAAPAEEDEPVDRGGATGPHVDSAAPDEPSSMNAERTGESTDTDEPAPEDPGTTDSTRR